MRGGVTSQPSPCAQRGAGVVESSRQARYRNGKKEQTGGVGICSGMAEKRPPPVLQYAVVGRIVSQIKRPGSSETREWAVNRGYVGKA